jgi:hypothetical protein
MRIIILNTSRLYIFIFLFVLVPATFFPNPLEQEYTEGKTYNCAKWDVIDLTFKITDKIRDPFSIEFGAIFYGPKDTKLKISGFYNGNQSFMLRFSPPEVGEWIFVTYASIPSLSGNGGVVRSTPPHTKRHGPVVLKKENPQHFFYEDNTPCLLLAFELDWLFALDCNNKEGIPKTKKLISQIAHHGYNQIIMNVYAYDVSWDKDPSLKPEHEFGAPNIFPFGGTNSDPDFSELNVDFFNRLDRVIRYLDQQGIIAHLMIYVWNKNVNWPDMYSAADNLYFDYVITRYQAFTNIIWDISKEALSYGRCDMDYISERIQRVRQRDAHHRLLTVHDYSYCSRYPEKVDFISLQSWRSDLYHEMRSVRGKHSNKPIFNIEHGGYEQGPYTVFNGDYSDPEVCLERNYQCIFAGTYSTYYWQCTAWNVIIPDPMSLPDSLQPKFEYYRHLNTFFSRYDFSKLKPYEDHSSSGYCLSNLKDLFIYFVPEKNYAVHVTLPEDVIHQMQVLWFNPFTGKFLEKEAIFLKKWHEFISPWIEQMSILILQSH